MKKLIYAALTCLMLTGATHADIVAINNVDATAGTYSGFTSTAVDANTFNLTATSDFDSGGVVDTLSFTLTRTTYGPGTISAAGDVTVGAVNSGGNTNNWYSSFNNAETLQLDISNVVYASGEADGTTAVFAGFTNINRLSFGGTDGVSLDTLIHTSNVGSTAVTTTGTPTNNELLPLTSAGTSSTVFITAEAGNGTIRLRDLDLQFETIAATAVPEPSSLAVLLGGLGILTLRRRRN